MNASEVTQDQIEAWKKKYGRIKQVTVSLGGDKKEAFIVAKPTREILDIIARASNDNNPTKMREVMEKSCVLAGDTSTFSDPNVMNTVFGKITDMLEKLEAEEKEL